VCRVTCLIVVKAATAMTTQNVTMNAAKIIRGLKAVSHTLHNGHDLTPTLPPFNPGVAILLTILGSLRPWSRAGGAPVTIMDPGFHAGVFVSGGRLGGDLWGKGMARITALHRYAKPKTKHATPS
jgi:hypothetical protein